MTPLAKLKAAALAASPGPWEWDEREELRWGSSAKNLTSADTTVLHADDFYLDGPRADFDYIASASPDVVLALVASVEDLQEALEHIIEGTHSINKMAGIENVARNALTRHAERFP